MSIRSRSIINAKKYQKYLSIKWRRGLLAVLAGLVTLVFIFSLTFEKSLLAVGQRFTALDPAERSALLRSVFNPTSIAILLLVFIVLKISARSIAKKHHAAHTLFTQTPKDNVGLNTDFDSRSMIINPGVHNTLVVKNYQGYLHIQLPIPPSSRDTFFIANEEKLERVLNSQVRSLGTSLNIRTKDGISITIPHLQLQYRFNIEQRSNKNEIDPSRRKLELERTKQFVLHTADLSLETLVSQITHTAFHQYFRKLTLDDLTQTQSAALKSSIRTDHHFSLEQLQTYKCHALGKYLHLISSRTIRAQMHRRKGKHAKFARKHTVKIRQNRTGSGLFSTKQVERGSQEIRSTMNESIQAKIRSHLAPYNIQLVSMNQFAWIPSQTLVNEKLKQTHAHSHQFLDDRRSWDKITTMRESKERHLEQMAQAVMNAPSEISKNDILLKIRKYAKSLRIPFQMHE